MAGLLFTNKQQPKAAPVPNIVENYKGPNVSQYGWTTYEVEQIKQLIQYVDMARAAAESAISSAKYTEEATRLISEMKNEITNMYNNYNQYYQNMLEWYTDFTDKYSNFLVKYQEVLNVQVLIEDLTTKVSDTYLKVVELTDQAAIAVSSAEASATAAEVSNVGAKSWYDKSYELYEALSHGMVYRGTWNPHSGAYPSGDSTNSTWDVILNEGDLEVPFDGKRWFWGDRLIYILNTNLYVQVESGTTVTSVNGKKGAVVITAADLDAVTHPTLFNTFDLTVRDIRDTNYTPSEYPKGRMSTFFNSGVAGFPVANQWFSGLNVSGWPDSNYASWQIASDAGVPGGNKKLWFRGTTPSDSNAWGNWESVLTNTTTATDIGAYPITGGFVEGQVFSRAATATVGAYGLGNRALQVEVHATGTADIAYRNKSGDWRYPIVFEENGGISTLHISNAGDINTNGNTYVGNEVCLPPSQYVNFNASPKWGAGVGWRLGEDANDGHLKLHVYDSTAYRHEAAVFSHTGDLQIIGQYRAGPKLKMGSSGGDAYFHNSTSSQYLQMRDSGGIYYANKELASIDSVNALGGAGGNWNRVQLQSADVNPMYELHVPGKTAACMVLNTSNNALEFWRTNGGGGWLSTIGYFETSGQFVVNHNGNFNDVYIRSDKRLKKGFKVIDSALDKVNSLAGYTYTKMKSLTDDAEVGKEVGIIAQDLQKILPEAVSELEDSTLTISNSAVNALLLQAIKELKAEVDQLKREMGR